MQSWNCSPHQRWEWPPSGDSKAVNTCLWPWVSLFKVIQQQMSYQYLKGHNIIFINLYCANFSKICSPAHYIKDTLHTYTKRNVTLLAEKVFSVKFTLWNIKISKKVQSCFYSIHVFNYDMVKKPVNTFNIYINVLQWHIMDKKYMHW